MLSLLILTRTHGGSLLRTVSFSTSTSGQASWTRKILQERKYRDLQESLKDQPEPPSVHLLSIARFILNENIRVARLALELDDILYFPPNTQTMDKRQIVRAANRQGCQIPAEIQVSRWTARDDSVILTNLKRLQVRTGLKHSEAEVMFARQAGPPGCPGLIPGVATPTILCHKEPARAFKVPQGDLLAPRLFFMA